MQVLLTPFAVLHCDAIRVFDGLVSLVLADDPTFVVSGDKPLGDLVEVEFASTHLRPRLSSVAREVLVVNVIHQVLPLVQRRDDIHATTDDVTHIGRPTSDRRVKTAEDDIVVFLSADERSGRTVRMIRALDAKVSSALGDGVDVASDVESATLEVLRTARRQSHGAEHGAREMTEKVDGEVSGRFFVRRFFFTIPCTDQREAGELHVMLLKCVVELDRIAEITEPVFAATKAALGAFEHHRLDAGEARRGGDLDHVIEFIVVAFAHALHEPGIDFGTELNFSHLRCSKDFSLLDPPRSFVCCCCIEKERVTRLTP